MPSAVPDPTMVKFEVKNYLPEPPKPKRSIFGGLLKVLGAFALPASFIPGIGPMIGAAGMSASMFGGHLQNKAAQTNAERAAEYRPTSISYPGTGISSAAFASHPELDLISTAHYNTLGNQIQGVK